MTRDLAPARLKAAFGRAVRSTPEGSAAALAPSLRVSARALRLYAEQGASMFAPVDVVAEVEALACDPVVTRVLADLSGHVLVARPCLAQGPVVELEALREASEATADIAAWVSPVARHGAGRKSGPGGPRSAPAPHRARGELRRSIQEAIGALLALDARLAALDDQEGRG